MRVFNLIPLFGIALSRDLGLIYENELQGASDATNVYLPRQSVQWPRPQSGYVKRTNDWACLSTATKVTPKSTLTDTDKAVIDLATKNLLAILDGKEEDCLLEKKGDTKKLANLIESVTLDIAKLKVALGPGVDESYKMVLEKGAKSISISAPTVWGARHALTTLGNMLEIRNFDVESAAATAVYIGSSGKTHHHILPYSSFTINDAPRLGHRGLMMDTSRSYQPLSTIQRTIKAMALAKMNVLHIHATDDQSFPLLIGKSAPIIHGPDCTAEGPKPGAVCAAAYSNHHTYTQAQIQALITEAQTNGIRVLIEIDQPAHARSWGSSNEKLRECADLEHQTDVFCAEPVCGLLALSTNYEEVQKLAKTVTDDWLALQSDPLMHYGMDEVKEGCWGAEKTEELSMKYLKDAVTYLKSKDPKRRMIVWQDVIVPDKHKLPEEVSSAKMIAQVWNDASVAESLLKGSFDIIWSPATAMYLDCGRGNPAVVNYTSWCSPYKTWWTIYKETPDVLLKSVTDTAGSGQVLGGEVALWAEQANAEIFDSLLWPRAAAWAGAAWEARTEIIKDPITDDEIEALYTNEAELRKFTNMIISNGVAATSGYTEWCVFEDKTMCDHYSRSYFGPNGPPPPTTTTPKPCSAVHRLIGGAVSIVAMMIAMQ